MRSIPFLIGHQMRGSLKLENLTLKILQTPPRFFPEKNTHFFFAFLPGSNSNNVTRVCVCVCASTLQQVTLLFLLYSIELSAT